jgi:hypothetical protein
MESKDETLEDDKFMDEENSMEVRSVRIFVRTAGDIKPEEAINCIEAEYTTDISNALGISLVYNVISGRKAPQARSTIPR